MKNKWFVWVIIVGVVAWLAISVIPRNSATNKINPGAQRNEIVEPQFKYQGDLWVLHPEQPDTLQTFKIEFADTESKIQYGMMYRKTVDPQTGMLFLFDDSDWRSFYMKNTYVPLDIIFIDANHKVVSIQKNAEPLNLKSLPSEGPAQYVFEILGGLSDQLGIDKGYRIFWQRN